MTTVLQQVKGIDTNTIYTVSGYIREQHELLKSSPYTLFQNIPREIPSLCTLYYHANDYFEIIGKNTSVSKDGYTLSKQESGGWDNTTFGSYTLSTKSKCIYRWNLSWSPALDWDHSFVIGLASAPFDIDRKSYDQKENKLFYVFVPFWSTKKCHTMHSFESIEPDKTWREKAEIGIEFDAKHKRFSIYTQESKSIVFTQMAECEEYRLAISMLGNFQVSITKFECVDASTSTCKS